MPCCLLSRCPVPSPARPAGTSTVQPSLLQGPAACALVWATAQTGLMHVLLTAFTCLHMFRPRAPASTLCLLTSCPCLPCMHTMRRRCASLWRTTGERGTLHRHSVSRIDLLVNRPRFVCQLAKPCGAVAGCVASSDSLPLADQTATLASLTCSHFHPLFHTHGGICSLCSLVP